MKIMELCLSPGLGGLELYVYRSFEALDQRGHHVLPVLQEDSRLDKYFSQHASARREYIASGARSIPLLRAFSLAALIDREQIDIIHLHWGKDMSVAVLAKLFSRRRPAIVYTRQMNITRSKLDWYHQFLYRHIDMIITITHKLEILCKEYIGISDDRIITIYYGVNPPEVIQDEQQLLSLRKDRKLSEDDFVVGLFGRLEEGKGQHLLIEAIKKAKDKGVDIKALIVGHEMNPGYQEQMEILADSYGVSPSIYFNGFTSKPQELMQICDCLCLASFEETFGLVLPEAMRCGIPVLGSNAGGVPEIIDDHDTGLLFESRSSSDLCDKLIELHHDPELRKDLARRGKDKADSMFDTESHFDRLDRLFAETKNNAGH